MGGMRRLAFLALGWVSVALGLIGVVLPGLPTTPFLLVAAFAFGKSSPGLRAWLEQHPQFGPPIRNWEENGAISRNAKTLAVSMMALIFAISLALGLKPLLLLIQGLCMAGAAAFILSRPD